MAQDNLEAVAKECENGRQLKLQRDALNSQGVEHEGRLRNLVSHYKDLGAIEALETECKHGKELKRRRDELDTEIGQREKRLKSLVNDYGPFSNNGSVLSHTPEQPKAHSGSAAALESSSSDEDDWPLAFRKRPPPTPNGLPYPQKSPAVSGGAATTNGVAAVCEQSTPDPDNITVTPRRSVARLSATPAKATAAPVASSVSSEKWWPETPDKHDSPELKRRKIRAKMIMEQVGRPRAPGPCSPCRRQGLDNCKVAPEGGACARCNVKGLRCAD